MRSHTTCQRAFTSCEFEYEWRNWTIDEDRTAIVAMVSWDNQIYTNSTNVFNRHTLEHTEQYIRKTLQYRKRIGRVEDRRQVPKEKGQEEQEGSAPESASAPRDARVTRLPRLPRAPRSPGGPAAPAAPRSPRAPSAPSTHRTLRLAPHTTSNSLSLRTIATAKPRCIHRPLSEFTFY